MLYANIIEFKLLQRILTLSRVSLSWCKCDSVDNRLKHCQAYL